MKIYLAGPMRGIPYFNFPAFERAAAMLRAEGHTVLSPAEADTELFGAAFGKDNPTGDERGFDIRAAMQRDLTWICQEADAIALLPGWASSKGARAENALAECLGIERRFL